MIAAPRANPTHRPAMRRIVLEDPLARSAIWSRNLAVFALIVALIGIVLSRKGLDPQAAVAIVGAALAIAGLAVLSALVAMAVIWQTGFRGIGLALGGIVLAALLFAYPAYLAVQARAIPSLDDVSTDVDDPPSFLATPAARAARHGETPPLRPGKADLAQQNRLYPDLQSLSFDIEADEVEKAIHKLIKRHRWTVLDEVKAENFATGHIDVVATSRIMGFPADVTFRIRELGARTQVDVRSVVRAGWHEQPGSNGMRVVEIVAELEDALGAG